MLHLVASSKGHERCKKLLLEGDTVVFLGDGCFSAQPLEGCTTFIVESDAFGRGIAVDGEMQSCNMHELVELVVTLPNSVTWT